MLHAVTGNPRQIICDEGVRTTVEIRGFAKHGNRLFHHLFHHLGVIIHLLLRAGVVYRQAYGTGTAVRRYLPLPQCEIAHFDGTVHEVVEVGCRKGHRIVRREQLRGHAPLRAVRQLEGHANLPVAETPRPHESGRHIQMGMSLIHLRIGSICPIGKKRIRDPNRTIVNRHVPLVRIRPGDLQGKPVPVLGSNRVHVLGEVVERVAPRGGTAHSQLERHRRQIGKRNTDLRLVVHDVGKGYLVDNLSTRRRYDSGAEDARTNHRSMHSPYSRP